MYVGKENKKQETKMNKAANKENITPEKVMDNQERKNTQNREVSENDVTPMNKRPWEQDMNAPLREIQPVKRIKLNFKPRQLDFSSAGENAETDFKKPAQVLAHRMSPVTPENVTEPYVHKRTPRYTKNEQEVMREIKLRSQALREENTKLEQKITEKLRAIRIETEKKNTDLEEGEIDSSTENTTETRIQYINETDMRNKEHGEVKTKRNMEVGIISKRDVEKIMNTLTFHRKNTVARVRYQERNSASNDLLDEQMYRTGNLSDQRNNCQVCFSNTSPIMEHRIQGGFAKSHKLGLLPEKKKKVLKILTLMDMKNGILMCRNCNYLKINLRERNSLTAEEYEHITNHGYVTGENPTVEETLYYNGKNTLFVCLECEQVFPSYLSLTLHSLYFKEHTKMYSEVYCPLCGKFEAKTTFSAHLLKKHVNQVKCLMCPAVFQNVNDLITHVVQPNPHKEITTEIRSLLTDNQVSALHKYRKENTMMHQRTDVTVIPIMKEKDMIEYRRYLNQPELLGHHQIEQNAQERNHPRNCQDILAKFSNRELSLQLSNVLQSIKLNTKYIIPRKTFEEIKYELNQTSVSLIMEKYCSQLVELPLALEIKQYGIDNYEQGHLLRPSVLAQSENVWLPADLRIYDCIIIGNHGMKDSGTLPGASFRTLNLSPQKSFVWPNCFITLNHWKNSVQGTLELDEKYTEPVPDTENYLLHVKNVLSNIQANKPTFVEFNLQGFLHKIPTEKWSQFLEKNLKTLTEAYFIGLERIRQELERTGKLHSTPVVIGQGPISGILQLSAKDMNKLTERIDQAGLLISRLLRVTYIPISSLVGYGSRAHGNILGKPQPPLDLNHQWTTYARHQVLKLLQDYMATREDILNRAQPVE